MTKRITAVLLGGVLFLSLSSAAGIPSFAETAEISGDVALEEAPVVEVTGGAIQGYYNEEKTVAIYKGIPYAADTSGENRWKSPQPVEEWEGILDCTEFGDSAVQIDSSLFSSGYTAEYNMPSDAQYSEDCLNLNVWTSTGDETGKPVIVYFHGGGLIYGGSSVEIYDGENLAEEGVVYVSVNYRVGILGYLATSELAEEDEDGVAGNYGLRDQIAALEWVQENIETFGGDPDNVTIVGQSSGAASVNALVSSPKASGLFRNAWAMSYPSANYGWSSQEEKIAEGDALFEGMTLEEMRALTSEEIMSSYMLMSDGINIDGVYVPDSLEACLNSGVANDVNYVTGTLPGDTSTFYMMTYSQEDIEEAAEEGTLDQYYISVLESLVGEYAEYASSVYPLGDDASESIDSFMEDMMLANAYWVTASHDYGTEGDSYIYFFDYQIPGSDSVFHSSEIGYFLNHFSDVRSGLWTEEDYDMGRILSGYLINFAETGNPNGTDADGSALPEWSVASDQLNYLLISDEISEVCMSEEKLAFWNSYIAEINTVSACGND